MSSGDADDAGRTEARSKGTHYLITGVEGFTGKHMLDLLLARPGTANVTCVHFAPFALPSHEGEAVLAAIETDVTKPESIESVVEEASPDVVLHFAGLVSVAQSFKAPMQYLDVNVEGTLKLLDLSSGSYPVQTRDTNRSSAAVVRTATSAK